MTAKLFLLVFLALVFGLSVLGARLKGKRIISNEDEQFYNTHIIGDSTHSAGNNHDCNDIGGGDFGGGDGGGGCD